MSFEFFFGLFGLISSDSRRRHESRLETDWRLFTPLGASLFREPLSVGSSATFNELLADSKGSSTKGPKLDQLSSSGEHQR